MGITAGRYPSDHEHVPTIPELHKQGLAIVVDRNAKGEPTHYQTKPEGQQLINDVMERNARRGRAFDIERLVDSA